MFVPRKHALAICTKTGALGLITKDKDPSGTHWQGIHLGFCNTEGFTYGDRWETDAPYVIAYLDDIVTFQMNIITRYYKTDDTE